MERCEASHLPLLLLAEPVRGSFSPEQSGGGADWALPVHILEPNITISTKHAAVKNISMRNMFFFEIESGLLESELGGSFKKSNHHHFSSLVRERLFPVKFAADPPCNCLATALPCHATAADPFAPNDQDHSFGQIFTQKPPQRT